MRVCSDGGYWKRTTVSLSLLPRSGLLVLGKPLDRETEDRYTLVVTASDGHPEGVSLRQLSFYPSIRSSILRHKLLHLSIRLCAVSPSISLCSLICSIHSVKRMAGCVASPIYCVGGLQSIVLIGSWPNWSSSDLCTVNNNKE